jgi:hypothetical protein
MIDLMNPPIRSRAALAASRMPALEGNTCNMPSQTWTSTPCRTACAMPSPAATPSTGSPLADAEDDELCWFHRRIADEQD